MSEPIDSTLGMSDVERELTDDIYDAMMQWSRGSARSLQARDFRMGVSDLGYCSEKARRMLLGEQPDDTDEMLAWIGTAMGKEAEAAYAAKHPDIITQAEVSLTVPGARRDYTVTGHPDVIHPERRMVLDFKSSYGFSMARRVGPSLQQQFQRHGYGYAAWQAGYFGNCAAEEVTVGNVWMDRAGKERRLFANLEPLDHDYVRQAGEWFDEVVWAFALTQSGTPTEAPKEPPREVCQATCGFYETCRAYDTDVSGLLTDPTVLAAVDQYTDASAVERAAGRLKDEAKQALVGISGSTGQHMVRWTWSNETRDDDGKVIRAGSWRLGIKPIPNARPRASREDTP